MPGIALQDILLNLRVSLSPHLPLFSLFSLFLAVFFLFFLTSICFFLLKKLPTPMAPVIVADPDVKRSRFLRIVARPWRDHLFFPLPLGFGALRFF